MSSVARFSLLPHDQTFFDLVLQRVSGFAHALRQVACALA